MNWKLTAAFTLALGLALSGWLPSLLIAENTAKEADQENEGWEVLFDGTSLDAFRPWKADKFEGEGWTIDKDGTLRSRGPGSDMITRKQYSEFDLRWEWKLSKGANSGVMYRAAETGHSPADTGPEYQIIDDPRIHIGSTGSLYGIITPNDKAEIKPAGKWNSSRIVVQDNEVTHYLNGKPVAEYTWASEDIKDRIGKSKFKNFKGFMQQETGHIGFQSYNKDLWFRNIKIKDLSKSGANE